MSRGTVLHSAPPTSGLAVAAGPGKVIALSPGLSSLRASLSPHSPEIHMSGGRRAASVGPGQVGSEDEHLVRLKMIYIPICGSFVDIVAHMR